MDSVERIVTYTKLESEASLETSPENVPPEGWPDKGTVNFDNVSLQYSKNKHPILKKLTFRINSGEKIGIVGRTGAGKSSITAALFRMTEPTGTISIDGVAIREIGLQDVRRKISIIPQDPFLFFGPLRTNIDPFNEYAEDTLWNVLEDVDLKHVVEDMSDGLDTILTEGGRNFSVGQRQLICLARAILRQNKILVLDEATSNIDKVTDAYIQKIIKEKFSSCTVLTIAHRLETIIDSDRVMVLDAGRIQEFDDPYELLQKESGIFYNMVQKRGTTAVKEIKETLREKNVRNKTIEITKL